MSDKYDHAVLSGFIEEIASDFHEVWEELAPSHGHATQEATRVPWLDLPESIRKLTMEVVGEVLKRTVDKVDNAEKAKWVRAEDYDALRAERDEARAVGVDLRTREQIRSARHDRATPKPREVHGGWCGEDLDDAYVEYTKRFEVAQLAGMRIEGTDGDLEAEREATGDDADGDRRP